MKRQSERHHNGEQTMGEHLARLPVLRRPLLWGLGLCAVSLSVGAGPTLAQPSPPAAAMSAEAAQVAREWAELKLTVGAEEVTAPAKAIARYQEFYEARGFGNGVVAVEIASRIAQLYWRGLGERAKAGEVLAWAIAQYGEQPTAARLKRELALVNGTGDADGAGAAPDAAVAVKVPKVAPIGTLGGTRLPAVPIPGMAGEAPVLVEGAGGLPSVALTLLARRLSAGDLSQNEVEVAWQASGLSAAQVLKWLQTTARFNRDVQGALVPLMGLVARHAPELVSAPERWSEREELLLAKYYTNEKDERAEPIYLRLLEQIKAQPLQKREVPALYGLHYYYLATGRTEQAADTLLSASQYTSKLSVVGNTPVEAARLYRSAGKNEKAEAAYAQAEKSEFGWSVGLALYDQANALIERGQHQAARELLKRPVEGQFADQIQVGLLALLSDSYFRTGESEAARSYGEECLAQYEALMNPLQGEGLQEIFRAVKQRLRTIAVGGVYYDERIIQHGEGQLTGEPLYDEAYALIKADKHKEARALLQQPVTGADAAVSQVRLLSLLSASYLKTGEVELAQNTARKALETYRGLKNSQNDESLEYQVERAKKVLDWSGRYQAGQRSTTKTQP